MSNEPYCVWCNRIGHTSTDRCRKGYEGQFVNNSMAPLLEERERCAKIAEQIASESGDGEGEIYIARKIADAIRGSRPERAP